MADLGNTNSLIGKDFVLLASEDTTARLGWIGAKLPEIAQADVLAITREDLLPKGPLTGADAGLDEVAYGVKKLRAIFNEHRVDTTGHDQSSLEEYARGVLNNQASAQGMDTDGDGQNDFGLIILPDLDAAPEKVIGMFSGIPAEHIKDAPGTAMDYAAWITFHEAQHITQTDSQFGNY